MVERLVYTELVGGSNPSLPSLSGGDPALDGALLNVSTERGLERFDRAGGRRLLAPPVK